MKHPTDTRTNVEIVHAAQATVTELDYLLVILRECHALGPIDFVGAIEAMHHQLGALAETARRFGAADPSNQDAP